MGIFKIIMITVSGITLLHGPLHGQQSWKRHVIDDSSRGADGARMLDVNRDGLPDLVTPWEEGGVIRVCLHPGHMAVHQKWPAVTVGQVGSPEDAVFVDLDDDGFVDVVSSCEGSVRSMYVHWAPKNTGEYLDATKWETEVIPVVQAKQSWMFALPMQIDGNHGVDLIVASKGDNASVGWLQAPKNPRDLTAWKYHRLYAAGWIMSLVAVDVNRDGFDDVIITDRKGSHRGVLWLEHPAKKIRSLPAVWQEHRIGGASHEVMFMDVGDLNGDQHLDIVVATHQAEILVFLRDATKQAPHWRRLIMDSPYALKNGKSVAIGDMNLDGIADIVHSTEPNPGPRKPGVAWLQRGGKSSLDSPQVRPISDTAGIKFDLLQLVDLDGDGDLDVITCEERHNLGLFWYQNPTRK